MRTLFLLALSLFSVFGGEALYAEAMAEEVFVGDTILTPEDLEMEADHRLVMAPKDSVRIDTAQFKSLPTLSAKDVRKLKLQNFVPNPKRALWLSLVLPGAGQIYNRKYWKLPIFYGGFLGCTYAFLWNQQMYRDYSQAYLDLMDSDANTKSYLDFLPPNFDITGREQQYQTLFKNRRDRYRRYRDLSGFAFVGVYLLSVIDAYVDAQLSQFDITPDLSLRIEPAVIGNDLPAVPLRQRAAYGVGCALTF